MADPAINLDELTPEQQLQLLEDIWDRLSEQPANLPLSDELRAELDRRTVVVLSRGMDLVLQTCPQTLAHLRERGVQVHVEETRAAVELYNRLSESQAVGGLFHSTC